MKFGWYTICVALALLFLTVNTLIATDEKTDPANDEELTSVTEDRKEILSYGIDDEVAGLLDALKEERDEASLQDAFAAFQGGVSHRLKIKFLEYFKELEYREAEGIVIDDLVNYEDLDSSYLLASISYLSTGMKHHSVVEL